MTQENKPKTFEEIDARLHEDLKKINGEIEEIENHLQLGQDLLEKQIGENATPDVIEKYRKGLDELQKGLEMFLGIKDEIQSTIAKLYDTKAQADEHIK
ncbi:MAG: hypothetical protein ACD_14C00032G0003 [uncultured bacterium]|nr:MAG: hypothetical protein ACD_14C00032G0003 [uncultured bacterium]